ncbi:uncharacterized protein RSE6_05869 [Rhynchosporium secalis]|uniref:Transcription factor CBF/NF-Y/archaeal histone domain-containing protein n=1 Tax=Rhynchosporium secalis TaxID=38038 RepID=A0A1E1M8X2_RHYSE|nr:uncharacterized protein RSE6_05869 [Rhynchosporium secalis]
MAATQKLYPRATVKKIVKAHSKRNVSKNVDVLIFLDYALFLQTYAIPSHHFALAIDSTKSRADELTSMFRLMKEATINAKQAGERGISARSVKKVTENSLSRFKG